ncbi:MAG: phosphotransferase [Clostridia bacterium]
MSNTTINLPTVCYVCPEKKILVENYIPGISLNEYMMQLTPKRLYDIGRLMGEFHDINTSSQDNEQSWIVTILSDMLNIRQILAPYEDDFIESMVWVEEKCKELFSNLHFTYVHGDFRPANIIYNQVDEKYYLIDFENFMIGDPTLDAYKMLSILKSFEDVKAFLNGYLSIKALPEKLVDKWIFYDIYYSLRSVRRAINDNNFRKSDDQYIINADMSAQRKNARTLIMTNWLEKYFDSLH